MAVLEANSVSKILQKIIASNVIVAPSAVVVVKCSAGSIYILCTISYPASCLFTIIIK